MEAVNLHIGPRRPSSKVAAVRNSHRPGPEPRAVASSRRQGAGSSASLPTRPTHKSFAFTAATSPDDELEAQAGWRIRIRLDREGRSSHGVGSRWRSGEAVNGFVELQPEGHAPKRIGSVICRAFWQASTQYESQRIVAIPQLRGAVSALLQSSSVAPVIKVLPDIRAEWHRGYCLHGGEGIELWDGGELENIEEAVDSRSAGWEDVAVTVPYSGAPGRKTLHFSFGLPTTTRVTASSPASFGAPPSRRILQTFQRTPPPSLNGADCPKGCVEWIVEVLVRFDDEEGTPASSTHPIPLAPLDSTLPSFESATSHRNLSLPAFGLLQSTPSLLVQRVVFPFEPSDAHSQDLYSSWRPKLGTWAIPVADCNGISVYEMMDETPVLGCVVPSFGQDPRDEALGLSVMGPRRAHPGDSVERDGGRAKCLSFVKRIPVRFGQHRGWIRSETSVPRPTLVPRNSSHLAVLLHLSAQNPDDTSTRRGSKRRLVFIEKAVLSLTRRTNTRGGREERSTVLSDEICRQEIQLWDDALAKGSSKRSDKEPAEGRSFLKLVPGASGHDIKLSFDLQGEGFAPSGQPLVPLRNASVSFRTPNVEQEYLLSVRLHPVGRPSFIALHTPIQVIAGDFDAAPSFEAVVDELPIPLPSAADANAPPGYDSL